MNRLSFTLALLVGTTLTAPSFAGMVCFKNAGAYLVDLRFVGPSPWAEIRYQTIDYKLVANGDMFPSQIICSPLPKGTERVIMWVKQPGHNPNQFATCDVAINHQTQGDYVYVVSHGVTWEASCAVESLPESLHNGNPNQRKE